MHTRTHADTQPACHISVVGMPGLALWLCRFRAQVWFLTWTLYLRTWLVSTEAAASQLGTHCPGKLQPLPRVGDVISTHVTRQSSWDPQVGLDDLCLPAAYILTEK